MMKSVLALCALFVGALAQDECMSQTGGSFQFCFERVDINVYWNWSATSVDMLYEATDDGWKAVGFTSGSGGSSMLNSNVVLGCYDALDATPAGADGEIRMTRAAPVAQGNQNLASYNQTRVNNLCAIRFVRPTEPEGLVNTQHLTNRNQRVIAARGGAQLAPHSGSNRAAFDVNFATGEGAAAALAAPKVLVAMIAASMIAVLW